MIDYEFALRASAVVAAAAVVAAPSVVAYAQSALAWVTAKRPSAVTAAPQPDDAHTVVEIARRLQAAGNKRGVELCQQLLDVLLMPEVSKK
jgi:hypothetical protein